MPQPLRFTLPRTTCIHPWYSDGSGAVTGGESVSAQLAKRFANAIPEEEMSVRDNFPPAVTQYLVSYVFGLQVASLQGYLLKNKTRPRECVEEVAEWCEAVLLV
jgi:hypothetical protein